MDVKQAVKAAKDYVASLYAEEDISNIGLEEVELDPISGDWKVTIGFSRPWDRVKSTHIPLSDERRPRSYKLVRINDDSGQILTLSDRILFRSN